MMDSNTVRNVELYITINLRNSASCWLLLNAYTRITMHGPQNVRMSNYVYTKSFCWCTNFNSAWWLIEASSITVLYSNVYYIAYFSVSILAVLCRMQVQFVWSKVEFFLSEIFSSCVSFGFYGECFRVFMGCDLCFQLRDAVISKPFMLACFTTSCFFFLQSLIWTQSSASCLDLCAETLTTMVM
jgi:hypothetical protein